MCHIRKRKKYFCNCRKSWKGCLRKAVLTILKASQMDNDIGDNIKTVPSFNLSKG